jgi:hypothetical protein
MTELQPVPRVCICDSNDDEQQQQQQQQENKIKMIVSNRCLISCTRWKLPSGSNSKKSNCYTRKMEEAHSSRSFLTIYQLTQ